MPRQQGPGSREQRQGVSELVVEAPSEGLSDADVDGDRLVTAPWIKRSSEIDADGADARVADARVVEKAHAPGLSHLSFAELGEEACKESLAQGGAKEL